MPEQRSEPFAIIKQLESEIGIAPGFLEGLLKDGDDWSFVIKVHAVAEAALTHLLTTTVGREELRDLFGSLPMGDSRRGRISVAAQLHLLDPRRVAFFRALGRIRNAFVHDIKNAGLRIEQYAASLAPSEQDRLWLDLMGGHTLEPIIIDFDGKEVPTKDFARAHPRFTIWISTLSALGLIYRATTLDDTNRKRFFEELRDMKPLRGQSANRSR
jgi:hypothetical protein